MKYWILLFLVVQLHGEELTDLGGNVTTTTTAPPTTTTATTQTTETTTTTAPPITEGTTTTTTSTTPPTEASTTSTSTTTVAPEILIPEINTTVATSAQAPAPTTPESIPVTLSILETIVGNETTGAANETSSIVIPFTVVLPGFGPTTFSQDPIQSESPEERKSESDNETVPKANEIPSFLIVDIISNAANNNSAGSFESEPTPSSPFLDGDKLNQLAINYILSQNVSENLVEDFDEIDAWEAPLELQRGYPYYLTGFDFENRPIWVSEWGKFDLKKVVLGGNKSMEEFNKYARKAVRIITKSHDLKSTPEDPVTQAAFIVDFDGLKLDQYAHLPTVMYALELAKEHRDIIQQHASKVVILNSNFIAQAAINLGRNVFGRLFERVEVFGTDKSRWVHHLRRIFPADQLPEWYGGTRKTHKPLFVYGK